MRMMRNPFHALFAFNSIQCARTSSVFCVMQHFRITRALRTCSTFPNECTNQNNKYVPWICGIESAQIFHVFMMSSQQIWPSNTIEFCMYQVVELNCVIVDILSFSHTTVLAIPHARCPMMSAPLCISFVIFVRNSILNDDGVRFHKPPAMIMHIQPTCESFFSSPFCHSLGFVSFMQI